MGMTTMQLEREVRDRLAEISERDFDGVTLGEAVRRLIREHEINQIIQRYEELRADPEEWASYQAEAQLTDNVAGDGLGDAREEYPEYNQ
jgi:phage protein D